MSFLVDDVMPFKICPEGMKIKNNPGVTYALHKAEIGRGIRFHSGCSAFYIEIYSLNNNSI